MQHIKTFGLIGWLVVAWSASALAATPIPGVNEGIQWARDPHQAQESAAQQRRLVLLHFWAPNCAPCETVERYVFPHPEVARAINANYIPVNINAQALPDVAKRYGVDRWPSDVILSPEGEVLSRTVSPKDARDYLGLLNRVAAARAPSKVNWGQLAQTSRQQPPAYQTNQFQTNGQSMNPTAGAQRGGNFQAGAFQGAPPGYQAARPTETTAGFGQYAANPGDSDPRGPAGNPYASGSGGASPAAKPFANAHSDPAPSVITNPQYNPGGSRPEAGRASAMAASGGSFGAADAGGGEFNARGPDYRQVTTETPLEPAAAKQEKPLALGGFCPVTLVESQQWKRGSAEFGAIHRGRTYLFMGQREQAAFLADPDRFSPVLSGYDPVRFSDSGEFVEGKRQHGVFYHDQIFLFADEAALERFWKAPNAYALDAHQAMLRNAVGNRVR